MQKGIVRMSRINGHFSEKLYNEELHALYEILKYINYSGLSEPDSNTNGALWRDGNELKYAFNNKWNLLFSDQFKITSNLTSATVPVNPVYGQLWIDNGTLKYYNGTEFVVAKADATEQIYDSFGFYNYLQIHNLEPYGENFISHVNTASQYNLTIEESAWIYNADTFTYSYSIPQAEYGLKSDFTYSLVAELFDGIDSYVLTELDDTEYQFTININGTITIYTKDAIRCHLNLFGTQLISNEIDDTRINTYLVPNASEDKIFINGIETQKHDRVNDVTIALPSDEALEKNVSLVHVNSDYLSNITTNLFLVNAADPYVYIREEFNNSYTEYYIYDMNTNEVKLLSKYEIAPDYISIPKGIVLTASAIQKYLCKDHNNTIVIAITYDFQSYKTKGTLTKVTNRIFDTSNGIYINSGDHIENTILFVDQQYVTNYSIDSVDDANYLYITDYSGEHEISLIRVSGKTIVSDPLSYDDGIMYITKDSISDYIVPMFYINDNLYSLDDFIYDSANNCYKTNISVDAVSSYEVFDADDLFVSGGIVSNSNYIPCSFDTIPEASDFMVIINHRLYDKHAIVRNLDNGNIYGSAIHSNDSYVVLRDIDSKFLIRSKIASSQVFIDRFDNAVVYINGSLALSENEINFVDYIYQSQIVKYNDTFYTYDTTTNSRIAINDEHLVSILQALTNQYQATHDDILFTGDDLDGKSYTVFAYKYGNSVEQPLISGELDGIDGDNVTYQLLNDHQYSLDSHSLSIYVNGIRQYPDSFEETSPVSFTLKHSTESKILYIIEPLESNEHLAKQYVLLNKNDKIDGYINTYHSSLSMANGFIRVFKNGVRMPADSYAIQNPTTLYIEDASNDDVFMIESCPDYLLREITVPIKFDQSKWFVGSSETENNGVPGDNIPESLISSKDFIVTYINGLAYGPEGCYVTHGSGNSKYIELSEDVKQLLDATQQNNGFITFEWR